MNFSLVMIGAHDGSKTTSVVHECALLGQVLLIEPMTYLFEKLARQFAGNANITCLNEVISGVDGES